MLGLINEVCFGCEFALFDCMLYGLVAVVLVGLKQRALVVQVLAWQQTLQALRSVRVLAQDVIAFCLAEVVEVLDVLLWVVLFDQVPLRIARLEEILRRSLLLLRVALRVALDLYPARWRPRGPVR